MTKKEWFWFWVYWLGIIIISMIICFCLLGCAYVHVSGDSFTSFTCMKDVSLDPNNGIVSVTSPKAENIITALAGFAAGLLVGL